jgi:hypothetical protein
MVVLLKSLERTQQDGTNEREHSAKRQQFKPHCKVHKSAPCLLNMNESLAEFRAGRNREILCAANQAVDLFLKTMILRTKTTWMIAHNDIKSSP